MSKPNKAQVKYNNAAGAESILRFHTVITEEHDVSTEITKYPIQSGFNVSNHAIRKNRIVSIKGAISNNLVVGAEEFHEYGINNVRLVFDILKELVRQATLCEVETNFSSYTNVIFTSFKTKLEAGKTDVMEFTIRGEEVQLATTINGNKPTILTFTPLSENERKARVDELLAGGIGVPYNAIISSSPVDFSGSCQIDTQDAAGNRSITTFEKVSEDPTSNTFNFNVHTTAIEVVGNTPTSYINWHDIVKEEAGLALPDVRLDIGLSTISPCLTEKLPSSVSDYAEDSIETALGILRSTVYGAAYSITGVRGNQSLGQVLLTVGVDCVVSGAMGELSGINVTGIPTVDQAINGAASIGRGLKNPSSITTLTRITSPTEDVSIFGGLI